jgi:hypothetical protein
MNFGFQNLPYLGASVRFSGNFDWRTGLAPGLYIVKTLAPLSKGEVPYYPNSGTYFSYSLMGDKIYPACLSSHPHTYHRSNPVYREFGYDAADLYYGTSIHSTDVKSILHPYQKARNAVWPLNFTVGSNIGSSTWASTTALRLALPNSSWYWNPLVSSSTSSPYKSITEEHKFIDASDPSSSAGQAIAPSFGHYLALSRLMFNHKNSYQLLFKPDEDITSDACYLKYIDAEESHDLNNYYCDRQERTLCTSTFKYIYEGKLCGLTSLGLNGPNIG